MLLQNFIIWNGSPEIVKLGFISLRWYGLLFALGFLISQQILYYIYQKEGKPKEDVDTLTIYMVLATLLGARLGHVIFYQPEIIWQDPLGIFLPFEFNPEFKFTGFQGLASHGGAFGILIALWLYSRKKKPGQSYLQVVDRIVIVVAITGALIRFGNFFNSEIIGKPTYSNNGVVFARSITDVINKDKKVEHITYQESKSPANGKGYLPLDILVDFKKDGTSEPQISDYLQQEIIPSLKSSGYVRDHIDQRDAINYTVSGNQALIKLYAIPRHPAQLYEAISCVFLFIFLYLLWTKYKANIQPGMFLGIFLIVCFGLRFLYEFLKKNQESFENDLPINMGQILSIPMIVAGIILLIWSLRKKSEIETPSKI